MKKTVSIILSAALCVCLAGCSGNVSAGPVNEKETVTEVSEDEVKEPEEVVSEENVEESSPETEETAEEEPVETAEPAEAEPEAEPLVFVQDEYVTYGVFEQDNNLDNGPEPIEWRVCYVDNEKALLMSKYILDCRQFHSFNDNYDEGSYGSKVTDWNRSDLKKWLNEDFYSTAFPEENIILDDPNGVDNGKVFTISFSEALDYVPYAIKEYDEIHGRDAYYYSWFAVNPTPYAIAQNEVHKQDPEIMNGWQLVYIGDSDPIPGEPNYYPMWYVRECPEDVINFMYSPVVYPYIKDGMYYGIINKDGYDISYGGRAYEGIVPFIWVNIE